MKRCLTVTIAALLITVSAHAGISTVTFDHEGYGAKGTAKVNGGGHTNYTVYAGVSKVKITNVQGQDNPFTEGSTIGAFCCDLVQPSVDSPITYRVIDPEMGPLPADFLSGPMGTQKANLLSELFGRYYDNAWLTDSSYTSTQKADAEAFQLCIWEIIYEELGSTLDVSTDSSAGTLGFFATDTNISLANNMLTGLDGTGPMAELAILSNCNKQDFITVVPEPATLAILGFGTLILHRRKRKA